MTEILSLAAGNLISPIILCFVLGMSAALARSDLTIPEAVAKGMSIYLLFAIGFKGGAGVAEHGIDARLAAALTSGALLSLSLPFIAYTLLGALTRLDTVDKAAVAAHYGSISIVTFVAASSVLESQGISSEGYMVAVAAVMEAPAILSALWIVARSGGQGIADTRLYREILLNGSIVLLVGAFLIGAITGEKGLETISPFMVLPFQGVLCLFLMDMGLVAGRGLRDHRAALRGGAILFGLAMPLVGSAFGLLAGYLVGLSSGGTALLMTLAASASYIAVPAAMRVALPEARPAVYLTLSLGVTFPFNLAVGIPIYTAVASMIAGGPS
ncbi:MAG: sodium-dependent bicarbonate transport family permease [Thiotrichales bacterium]|nr:sodium-dependent bicarbonate transport family permease [Thiotrichales bacterium]